MSTRDNLKLRAAFLALSALAIAGWGYAPRAEGSPPAVVEPEPEGTIVGNPWREHSDKLIPLILGGI